MQIVAVLRPGTATAVASASMPRVLLALLVAASACGPSSSAEAPAPQPSITLALTYTPPRTAPAITSITVPGTFNEWNPSATPLIRLPNGSWGGSIPAEGLHEYKFHINGAWVADMCRDFTWGDPARDYRIHTGALGCVSDGAGGRNAIAEFGVAADSLTTTLLHDPQRPADLSAAGGRIAIRVRASAGFVQGAIVRGDGQSEPMHRQLTARRQEHWRGTLPEGTSRYTISVTTSSGPRELGPFTVPSTLFRAVPWVGASVGYQIFPDRFRNGDSSNDSLTLTTDEFPFMHPAVGATAPVLSPWDGPVTAQHCCHQYFGGDLQGIIDRLDHLQSLGVTLLYLNPIFSSGSAHGYDTFDYLQVEPSFGDAVVLRALLQEAKGRGIRVMWDFVPNHVGVGHPAFQDAVRRGPASDRWSWFTFSVPHGEVQVGNGRHYATFAGAGSLPKLNTANAAVREHLMGVVRHWTGFGFHGIRVDVPNEVTDRVSFFRTFREVAKGIDPDVFLVGEIWQRGAEWLQGDQFDALMNYALGQDVIERFVNGGLSGAVALSAMAQLYADYPEASAAMQFNVISTHDNSRLLTKLGGGALGGTAGPDALARHRLASAMLYALPGVPVTFQGDECAFLGAGGGGTREENRYPMQWERCDQAMVMHYQGLARLRREVAALSSPAIRLHVGEGAMLSWWRGEPGSGEVLAIFNNGSASGSLLLPAGSWVDLARGERVNGRVGVGAREWRYVRRE